MGLMGTLAKVAIGYAAARGVDRLSGGQGMGGLLGGGAQVKAHDPNAVAQAQIGRTMAGQPAQGSNPMQDMMAKMQEGGLGALFGGAGGAGGANPMADMMAKLQKGGLDLSAIMAKATGGTGAAEGDRPGMLSQLGTGGAGLAGVLAAMAGAGASAQGKGVGSFLDAMKTSETAPEAEAAAGLMLRAMIQAAKSDGQIDAAEKAKLLETLGSDADPADVAFVKAQLAGPIDIKGLAADTPEAQKTQVYAASLMSIRVDTEAEAQYLDKLARALELPETTVNALHMQMGMQPLYA